MNCYLQPYSIIEKDIELLLVDSIMKKKNILTALLFFISLILKLTNKKSYWVFIQNLILRLISLCMQ